MPLRIDSSRPLRSNAQLVALVEAILAAPRTEQETNFVEWKSHLDLRNDTAAKFNVGRHILGFGNRHPGRAADHFGGCSYLVVGAEPQRLVGVAVEDAADLENWIGRYVGSDGPIWSSTYVRIQETDVLVISIEAPQWGDSLHTLQKTFDRAQAGRIFVRRNGQTEEAKPSEIAMLEERAKRTSSRVRIDVQVRDPDRDRAKLSTSEADLEVWLGQERKRLARPVPAPTHGGSWEDRILKLSSPPTSVLNGDTRSREDYDQEVSEYLSKADVRWRALVLEGAIVQRLAPLDLLVINETEENFAAVQVILSFPSGVFPFLDRNGPHELLDAPKAPKPWGEKSFADLMRTAVPEPWFGASGADIAYGVDPHVSFDPIHVRPHASCPLPPLDLVLLATKIEGSEISLRWTATSTSAPGEVSGEIVLSVATSAVQSNQLLKDARAD